MSYGNECDYVVLLNYNTVWVETNVSEKYLSSGLRDYTTVAQNNNFVTLKQATTASYHSS
jgi:hypothetical protein